jgi:hypothetical protein
MGSTTAPTTEPRSEIDDPSEDDVFEILSNRRRRFVTHALKRAEESVDVSEFSRHVTAQERGVDPETIDYDDRRNVQTVLTRTHRLKIDEYDVVKYDDKTKIVEATPVLDDLDVLRGKKIPWSLLYYLGLAAVVGALMLAVTVKARLFAALDGTALAVFAVTAFGSPPRSTTTTSTTTASALGWGIWRSRSNCASGSES